MRCRREVRLSASDSVHAEGRICRLLSDLSNSCRCGFAGAGPIRGRYGRAARRTARRRPGLSTRFHVMCARGQQAIARAGRVSDMARGWTQEPTASLRIVCVQAVCGQRLELYRLSKVELKIFCVARGRRTGVHPAPGRVGRRMNSWALAPDYGSKFLDVLADRQAFSDGARPRLTLLSPALTRRDCRDCCDCWSCWTRRRLLTDCLPARPPARDTKGRGNCSGSTPSLHCCTLDIGHRAHPGRPPSLV